MKNLKSIVITISCILCMLFCSACSVTLELYDTLDRYGEIIDGISQYFPPSEDDKPLPPDISIHGYKLLSNEGFDVPSSFSESSYALTSIDGKSVLIDRQGNKYTPPKDLNEILFDKYIYEENGLNGLKDVPGTILLNAHYDNIIVYGNNFLASINNTVYIYENGEISSVISENNFDISLTDNNCLIVDYELCDMQLRPIIFGGYRVVNIYDGIAKIKNENGRLGFFDIENNSLIAEPRYYTAAQFINGYAQVQLKLEGEYFVIDKSGDIKASFVERTFGMYDGYMFVLDDGQYKLFDASFNATGIAFSNVFGARVYGDYIIDVSCNRLFSVKKKKYVSERFLSIEPFEYGFICKNSDGSVLYDKELNKLGEFESIMCDKNIISVLYKGKYYYFSKVSEEK